MHTEFVTTRDGTLLRSVREALRDCDRALICVAFAAEAGVRLLEKELKGLRERKCEVGLISTTVFGTTTPAALSLAQDLGVTVRISDPSHGTFHPKVYLGIRDNGSARAVIASANLTSGLAGNVEAGMYLDGTLRDPPIKSAWNWAEDYWGDPVVELWQPPETLVEAREVIDPDLYALIEVEVTKDPVFLTLGRDRKRNVVRELSPAGLYVETDASRQKGTGAQLVTPWMVNVAWEYLKTHRTLTNRYLLDELRVNRSSFVCALLARLPGVAAFSDDGRIGVRMG